MSNQLQVGMEQLLYNLLIVQKTNYTVAVCRVFGILQLVFCTSYEVPVCVCVCFLPIHSGLQWTYQPGSHRKKVTGFLIHLPSAVRALIFVARRIQPFLSLVDREVEFCVLTI